MPLTGALLVAAGAAVAATVGAAVTDAMGGSVAAVAWPAGTAMLNSMEQSSIMLSKTLQLFFPINLILLL
ncbi:hypothetical protein D3C85_1534580 [compost metagenome]